MEGKKQIKPSYQFTKEYTRGNISVNISLRVLKADTANNILGEFAKRSHRFYLDMAEDMLSNKH